MPSVEKPKPVRYGEFASWYDAWVAAPEDDLVADSLFNLIGAADEQPILDLKCGQGRIARELARRGNNVVGVELSAELLQIAAAIDDERISYVRGDACTSDWWDLLRSADGTAD
jgi:2-polyprenyl-3-methyl-5-hydroxy-6-metoxy-1,4-benzoquinol methylase